jgi:hypothetical protein
MRENTCPVDPHYERKGVTKMNTTALRRPMRILLVLAIMLMAGMATERSVLAKKLTCASVLCIEGTTCIETPAGPQCVEQGITCEEDAECPDGFNCHHFVVFDLAIGVCLPLIDGEPCICTEEYNPVCGVDGQTYSNPCFAQCEQVKIKCEGECPCSK